MRWRGFIKWQGDCEPPATHENAAPDAEWLAEPLQLLQTYRQRIAALRLESGYSPEQFERLIGAVVYHVAEYVHLLPATRAENHSEHGGLLRFAIETACLAFRSADGKFLSGPVSTDVRNRERDRAWRYAAFLGGLMRPLGRCATNVQVKATERGEQWNPYQEPLWAWMRRVEAVKVEVSWRRTDAKPVQACSIWIAARITTAGALNYLYGADDCLLDAFLQVVNGTGSERLCEVVEKAYQAAIDQDLARMSSGQNAAVAGVQIQHRLLEALRALVREKWTLNSPGGRLWFTTEGVFLAWKAACNDIAVRLRADGVNGAPRDPDTIAELLVSHGVLTTNPRAVNGLKHYYKIVPQIRGVPKQGIEVVKFADPELIGLHTEGVDAIECESPGVSKETPSTEKRKKTDPHSLELPLDLAEPKPVETPSLIETFHAQKPAALDGVQQEEVEPIRTNQTGSIDLKRLDRFGQAGTVLKALAEQLQKDPGFARVVVLKEGVAIAYPEAIAPFCDQPQEFIAACEAQGLLVLDDAGGRRALRVRTAGQSMLPERYLVLSHRVARCLPLAVEH